MAEETTHHQRIEEYVKQNMQAEQSQEMQRAERLAELVMDSYHNKGGEELANVHTSAGFQEVHDYRGSEKIRWRLDRKKEQVAHHYDAAKQLFQKVYYAKDLTLADERELRAAYHSAEQNYNFQRTVGTAALALAYLPLTYRLAAVVRPSTLLLWTGAYYYGLYRQGLEPLTLYQLQSSLNSTARPFAAKYNI